MDQTHASSLIKREPPLRAEKKKSTRRWLWMGATALMGAVVGYFGVGLVDDLFLKPGGVLGIVIMLLSIPLIWLVVVGWHELGHIVGGWLVGGRFLLWVVGPLMLRRTPVGLRWARNRSVNVGGGMAICVPADPALVTPRRMAVMVLGGPVSSLLLMVLALLITPVAGAVGHNVLMFTAGLSGLVFALTIAPFVAGGFKSDGKRAWDMLKGDRFSDQEAALMTITTVGLGGTRPADYDPALVARATALADGSMFDLYGQITIYFFHADRGEWPLAQACLDKVIEGEDLLVPYMSDLARCEYAWMLATQTDFTEVARTWLNSAGKLDFDPATRLRAEAAVALAEGDPATAAAKIADSRHALVHRSLTPVRNPFAETALDHLETALKANV